MVDSTEFSSWWKKNQKFSRSRYEINDVDHQIQVLSKINATQIQTLPKNRHRTMSDAQCIDNDEYGNYQKDLFTDFNYRLNHWWMFSAAHSYTWTCMCVYISMCQLMLLVYSIHVIIESNQAPCQYIHKWNDVFILPWTSDWMTVASAEKKKWERKIKSNNEKIITNEAKQRLSFPFQSMDSAISMRCCQQ